LRLAKGNALASDVDHMIHIEKKENKKLFIYMNLKAKALFSSEKISDFAIVALSFLFDKYCPIMN